MLALNGLLGFQHSFVHSRARTIHLCAGFIELAQFALAFSGYLQKLPAQLDGFIFRVCLQNREAADEFLCLDFRR